MSEWINVKDRIPDMNDYNYSEIWKRTVLVTVRFTFDSDKKRFVSTELVENVINGKDLNNRHIIAWMPMPDEYMGDEEDKK